MFIEEVQFCVLDADSDGAGPLQGVGVLSRAGLVLEVLSGLGTSRYFVSGL